MKIAIIGFGVEGRAAYDYWRSQGEITICDQNLELQLPADVQSRLGDGYLDDLSDFDLVVRSPFVRPDAIKHDNVTSCTNEFLRVCPTKNIIGITGTKGKGTTSTLTARMLEAAGKRVHLGGNIGVAALDLLKNDIQSEDWVVLELSSYQLLDLKSSPHIAACLMVVPEHLDWHVDIDEYFSAKQQLFNHQVQDDTAIYYPDNENSVRISSASPGMKIPYMAAPGATVIDGIITIDGESICNVNELKLRGKHNWQNACAATTITWQIVKSATPVAEVLRTFSGLPFRIEHRREVDGVQYYNDSFATGPGATLAAIEAITEPKVMILGGHDRGLELDELAESLLSHGDHIRGALLIGDSKDRLADELRNHGFERFEVSQATTMSNIVEAARGMAQPGDAVVLSPAFASFGLFKNFEDRGRQFNDAVAAL